MRPLPTVPLAPCRELRLTVSRFSTIAVLGNCYSVPSRLIGTTLLVRVRAETLEGYVGSRLTFTLPRLHGRGQHAITYQHLIWSLVRKPGAFAHYRYRDSFYPTLTFRRAYDALCQHQPAHADREYLRILYLAATTSETEVETALGLVLESRQVPRFDLVRDLVRQPQMPTVGLPPINLAPYDQLLGRVAHE